ncbi:MAG: DNA methyltransferase, partial [Ignavibacteriaceae bacterium]
MFNSVKDNVFPPNERAKLYCKFKDIIETDYKLNRTIVSFQANKKEPYYRWFKYKEGFSKKLIEYFIDKYHPATGHILDPFAGSGATLFAAREKGWQTTGIELLPIGAFNIRARLTAEKITYDEFKSEVNNFWKLFIETKKFDRRINHIAITQGAFPEDNLEKLNCFLSACEKVNNKNAK